MNDVETAPVDDKFRVLLQYVGKLTVAPASLTQQDADAVYAAGWSPDALYDAVAVCALFNFMNRIVEGTGVKPIPDEIRAAMPRPPKEMTYSDLLDMMDQFRK
jgi:alkylhydroperoxidase family enzyme